MPALKKIRHLDLAAPLQAGGNPHLSAASGLVAVGNRLYVVADDELSLGVFETGARPGTLIRLLSGSLPHDPVERKKVKPDFESLVLLPPFAGFEYGALLALGSASTGARHRGVLLGLNANSAASTDAEVFDLEPMFAPLHREFSSLNIEGALVAGDEFRLFHRGNKKARESAMFRCKLAPVLSALAAGDALDPLELLGVTPLALGDLNGIPFTITDAALLRGGNMLFSAVAEDTEDSYNDGVCSGSAIGILDPGGRLRLLEQADSAKLEGIAVRAEGDTIEFWAVSDADDPNKPAALFTAEVRLR